MQFHLDFETRSKADLKKVGAFRYANDPSTEILCVAVACDDEEPLIWYKGMPAKQEQIVWDELHAISDSPTSIVVAHSAQFEISISDALWQKTFGLPPPAHHQWRCTAAMGRRAALPASLKRLAEALNLGEQKDAKGAALIRKFCVPQKKTGRFIEPEDEPEAFKALCDYCVQDVKVEQEIHKKLSAFELKGFPLQTFLLDVEINARGFPVNLDALRKADKLVTEETERLTREFHQLTTDHPVAANFTLPERDQWGFPNHWTEEDRKKAKSLYDLSPSQTGKVLLWLQGHGYQGKDLTAESINDALDKADPDSPLGRALYLKKSVSFASLKKIGAMLACAGPHDNRVRGTLTYHGAGTGRWSASLVQPQNFKRPARFMEDLTEQAYADICEGCTTAWLELAYGPPLEVISSCIRHFIQGSSGFLDVDYTAIEARIVAWQAQEQWRLDVFKGHGMIYEASVEQMFGHPTVQEFLDYKKETGKHHSMRQKGKIAELSMGYAGGVGAMEKMGALKMGLEKKELGPIVKAWREANTNITNAWRELENAAKQAIKNPGRRYEFGVRCCFFSTRTAGMDFLFMQLPSGRKLAYPQPKLEQQARWKVAVKRKYEEDEEIEYTHHKLLNPTTEQMVTIRRKDPKAKMSEAITFFGQLPKTVVWGRCVLFGGLGFENQIQGIAADVMACGALNAAEDGYEPVALIHDEILTEYDPMEGHTLQGLTTNLTTLPEWADGLPIAAHGEVVKFYKK